MEFREGERDVQVRGMGCWHIAKVVEEHPTCMYVEFKDGERRLVHKGDIIEGRYGKAHHKSA
jgi:hypothetical protein